MSIWEQIAGSLASASPASLLESLRGLFRTAEPEQSTKFTIAMIALSAKMAKADGVVTRDEIEAFRRVFQVAESDRANVARLFNLAKADVAGFDSYARQVARLFEDNPEMLRDVLDGLFFIAAADGVLHPAENVYLGQVADIFGVKDLEFRTIRARFVQGEQSPYDVLGVSPDISDADLRRAYHKLVAECHPDRMIARGVPEEFLNIATRKLAALNRAYEDIEHARRSEPQEPG